MNESLIQFPSQFPIKIMGENQDSFTPTIIAIVQRHAPDFIAASVEMRPSTGGKYLSLTCTINATSREQLDNLYRELSGHPQVKVVL